MSRLWQLDDVAMYLGIPTSSVYKMTSARSKNPIPHVKLGGRLRFRKHEIEEWLDLWAVNNLDRFKRAVRGRRK